MNVIHVGQRCKGPKKWFGPTLISTACADWGEERRTQMQVAAGLMFEISQPCWMHDDLEKTLRRWEAAVYEVDGASNDGDEALKELEDSRAALLALLRRAL